MREDCPLEDKEFIPPCKWMLAWDMGDYWLAIKMWLRANPITISNSRHKGSKGQ